MPGARSDVHKKVIDVLQTSSENKYEVTEKMYKVCATLADVPDDQQAELGEVKIPYLNQSSRLIVQLFNEQLPEIPLKVDRSQATRQFEYCLERFLAEGVHLEGVFRVSRRAAMAEEYVRRMLDGQMIMDLMDLDPYDLATMIKAYTRWAYPKLIGIEDLEVYTQSGTIDAYLARLDAQRRAYLATIAAVARKTASMEQINLMSFGNIARVFAPNMFQDESPLIEMHWISTTIRMVEDIFRHA